MNPPRLHREIEILPMDTSAISQRYIVRVGKDKQLEISDGLRRIMQLIDGNRTTEEIAAAISVESGKNFTPVDVQEIFSRYLEPYGLLGDSTIAQHKTDQLGYLYVKKRLFPQDSLKPLTRLLKYLFKPFVFYPALISLIFFHLFFYGFFEKPAFVLSALGGNELIIVYVIVFLSTLFHELGHSSACSFFGARHGDIGLGLYLYFLVFYADVTDVWYLKRSQRAIVDFAGMYFQLLLVPFLFFFYLLSGNSVFVHTIYAVNFSVVSSLNPFFRFDGYWLISDLLGVPNLRKRSQEALKFLVKKIVKQKDAHTPYLLQLPASRRYFLVAYSMVSTVFFLIFTYFIVASLPELLEVYPSAVGNFFSDLWHDAFSLDFTDTWKSFSSLLLPTLTSLMLVMIGLRTGRRVWNSLQKIYNEPNQRNS